MYTTHPLVIAPDLNQSLWRYQDLTKFLNLIHSSRLFFCRVDRLGDPFEGSYPKINAEFRVEWYKDILEKLKTTPEKFFPILSNHHETIRKYIFANCWHMNFGESAAMWRLYGPHDSSIALKTTFSKLTTSFDNTDIEIYIGKMNYLDYRENVIAEGNAFVQVLHKQLSYEHEKELRAITFLPNDQKSILEHKGLTTENGIYVDVNLNELIEEIYISPDAPNGFAQTVQKTIEDAGLGCPLKQSTLRNVPFF